MGNLVFQATLGGQVNLVGPNTASTYNIAVPAVAGTMVTTGDTGTVTNTMLAGSIANAKLLNSSVTIGSTAVSLGATVTAFAGITTLAMTGNLTLSGGTANGVAYLNGSNVVTTGSALTFDGTNFGVGTSSPAVRLSVDSGATAEYARFNSTNASGGYLRFLNSSTTIGYMGAGAQVGGGAASDLGITAANNLVFGYGGGTEGMRLTSTGLGIGTSSPIYKLQVAGTAAAPARLLDLGGTTTGFAYASIANTSGSLWWGVEGSSAGQIFSGDSAYASVIGSSNATSLQFATNATVRATFDTSGNLGLGVTPSAWYTPSGVHALQVAAGASIYGDGGGTATLNANWFLNSAGAEKFIGASNYALRYIQDSSGKHIWQTSTGASGGAGSAATMSSLMTLDASGNLLVGTTSAYGRLKLKQSSSSDGLAITASSNESILLSYHTGSVATIEATYLSSGAYAPITFNTSATERARIDTSGNLLVGVTSYNAAVNSNYFLYGSGLVSVGHVSGTASGSAFQQFVYNATQIGSITQAGTTGVLYNVTSDQRLKENIVDAPEFGSVIDSMQVRSYDWKADGNHQRAGFIAQELVAVAPEAVHQPADPEEMMAVDYSKLVPMLVKEIQSLRKRLAAAGI